jgi:hypothetical protein
VVVHRITCDHALKGAAVDEHHIEIAVAVQVHECRTVAVDLQDAGLVEGVASTGEGDLKPGCGGDIFEERWRGALVMLSTGGEQRNAAERLGCQEVVSRRRQIILERRT